MSFIELQQTRRKCIAVLGKNPNSETHKDLLEKTNKAIALLNGTKPAKKTKPTKKKAEPTPEPEATATVPTSTAPTQATESSASI